MMDGVIVLSQHAYNCLPVGATILNICLIALIGVSLVAILFLWEEKKATPWCIIAIIAAFILILTSTLVPRHIETVYKVYIPGEINFKEFTDTYTIESIEDNIIQIREK